MQRSEVNPKPIRVKLRTDLTKYNSRCAEGALGWTVPDVQFAGNLLIFGSADVYVAVRYDNGAKLDTLWRSLEIISDPNQPKEKI